MPLEDARRQLCQGRTTEGGLARPWRRHFWTLSVWEDEHALTAFVQTDPHRGAMGPLQPDMGPTRFTRWPLRAKEYPPSWAAAFARASAQGPGGA